MRAGKPFGVDQQKTKATCSTATAAAAIARRLASRRASASVLRRIRNSANAVANSSTKDVSATDVPIHHGSRARRPVYAIRARLATIALFVMNIPSPIDGFAGRD